MSGGRDGDPGVGSGGRDREPEPSGGDDREPEPREGGDRGPEPGGGRDREPEPSEGRQERGAGPGARDSEARLDELRARILELDDELIRLVGERRDRVLEVGRLKGALGLPVLDPGREAQVVRRAAERARALGVDEEMVRDVIWRIIASARDAQEGRTTWGPPPAADPEGDS